MLLSNLPIQLPFCAFPMFNIAQAPVTGDDDNVPVKLVRGADIGSSSACWNDSMYLQADQQWKLRWCRTDLSAGGSYNHLLLPGNFFKAPYRSAGLFLPNAPVKGFGSDGGPGSFSVDGVQEVVQENLISRASWQLMGDQQQAASSIFFRVAESLMLAPLSLCWFEDAPCNCHDHSSPSLYLVHYAAVRLEAAWPSVVRLWSGWCSDWWQKALWYAWYQFLGR